MIHHREQHPVQLLLPDHSLDSFFTGDKEGFLDICIDELSLISTRQEHVSELCHPLVPLPSICADPLNPQGQTVRDVVCTVIQQQQQQTTLTGKARRENTLWVKFPLSQISFGSKFFWVNFPLGQFSFGSIFLWVKFPLGQISSGSIFLWVKIPLGQFSLWKDFFWGNFPFRRISFGAIVSLERSHDILGLMETYASENMSNFCWTALFWDHFLLGQVSFFWVQQSLGQFTLDQISFGINYIGAIFFGSNFCWTMIFWDRFHLG